MKSGGIGAHRRFLFIAADGLAAARVALPLARDGQYTLGAPRLWEQGVEALDAGNEALGRGRGHRLGCGGS